MLGADRLHEILHYDPETGEFRWKTRRDVRQNWNTRNAGHAAGIVTSQGYRFIRIDGRRYSAHRLAWLYQTGAWPACQVDHVNCARADNRWANLREATQQQNSCNAPIRANNKSGLKGVSFHSRSGKWFARIAINKRSKNLGYFDTPQDAHEAYVRAARLHHGEFARLS